MIPNQIVAGEQRGRKMLDTMRKIRMIKDHVLITDLQKGIQQSKGGIIIPDDNMKREGIHPRWARVLSVGPDVDGIKVGDWILLKHAHWSRVFKFDGLECALAKYPDGVLLISEEKPDEYIYGYKPNYDTKIPELEN